MPTERQPCLVRIGAHVDSLLELPRSPGWRVERAYYSLLPPCGRWAHPDTPLDGPSNPSRWVQSKEGVKVGWPSWAKPTLQPSSTSPGYRAHVRLALFAIARVTDPLDVEPQAQSQLRSVDGV